MYFCERNLRGTNQSLRATLSTLHCSQHTSEGLPPLATPLLITDRGLVGSGMLEELLWCLLVVKAEGLWPPICSLCWCTGMEWGAIIR